MSKQNPLDELKTRAIAAREGMDIEESHDQASIDIDAPEETEDEGSEVEESAEDTEIEESDEEEQEGSDESQEEDDSTVVQTQARPVFKQFNELRSQKRQVESEKKQLLDLLGSSSVEEAVAKVTELKALQPMSPEFIQMATDLGIEDPENLKKISDLIADQVRKDLAPKIQEVESNANVIQEARAQNELNESLQMFETEWDSVLPLIDSEYKPSATQLKEAHDYLAKVSHTEAYFDKELDYILYKEAENLESILGARKRKTMLTGRGRVETTAEKPLFSKTDGSHQSILEKQRKLKALANTNEFEAENATNRRI